jgi:VanZ family protein
MNRRTLIRGLWAVTIFYWLIIFTLTHIPRPPPPPIPMTDKVEHLLAYGTLALLLSAAMHFSGKRDIAVKVMLIVICYAAIDEWLQAIPFIHRDCEFLDWCADQAGAAVAVVLFWLVIEYIAPRSRVD